MSLYGHLTLSRPVQSSISYAVIVPTCWPPRMTTGRINSRSFEPEELGTDPTIPRFFENTEKQRHRKPPLFAYIAHLDFAYILFEIIDPLFVNGSSGLTSVICNWNLINFALCAHAVVSHWLCCSGVVAGLTFGWSQPGVGAHARLPPELKTPRIWSTIFGRFPKPPTKKMLKKIKWKIKLFILGLLIRPREPWFAPWSPLNRLVGAWFVLRGPDSSCEDLICPTGPGSSVGTLICSSGPVSFAWSWFVLRALIRLAGLWSVSWGPASSRGALNLLAGPWSVPRGSGPRTRSGTGGGTAPTKRGGGEAPLNFFSCNA